LFYAWGKPVYTILLVFMTVSDYILGLDIAAKQSRHRDREARRGLIFAIAFNLAALAAFKYAGFFLNTFNTVFHTGLVYHAPALPVGISFYTFRTLSYLIDLYRGKYPPQKSLLKFGVYVTMFPQLLAGPIVRYADFAEQIDNRVETIDLFGGGVSRFVVGMAKKVILADMAGQVWTRISATAPSELSARTAWIGIIAFTFQIYFDFSGYSDMAIGLGQMFGFRTAENFDYPYASASVTEFWRRWHISLGSWFRDYVYIPLGGNREGTGKQIRNLLIVWALTGFWHGAAWTFVAWGLYYGAVLIFEKFIFGGLLKILPAFFKHAYTMFIVIVGWVFFASSGIGAAGGYLKAMFAGYVPADAAGIYYLRTYAVLLILLIFASLPVGRRFARSVIGTSKRSLGIAAAGYAFLFVLSVAGILAGSYSPFLYFQF